MNEIIKLMAKQAQKSVQIEVDSETFKNQVELFVQHHRKRQQQPDYQNELKNKDVQELIEEAPILPDKAIDVFFTFDKETSVLPDVVGEVHESLKAMQAKINELPSKKRFFILETANFFSSKISIGKLIPALLLMEGLDQKKIICEFVLPTFLNINKNIEILVADDSLFDPKTLHIERGLLYSFISDLAKTLVKLFNQEFVEEFGEIHTPLEFFLTAFKPGSFKIQSSSLSDSEYIYEEMIDDPDEIRDVTLEFVTLIQSHDSLYHYSLKRHAYYKAFLAGILKPGRFEDIDDIDISRIVAGCLVKNGQLLVEDDLIDSLIDEDAFEDADTLEAFVEFIDQLAPSTIYKLIIRIRMSLQHLAKANFTDEFQDVQKMSVRNVLKTIWVGVVRLLDKGISLATEPIKRAVDVVKTTYKTFAKEEKAEEKGELEDVAGRKGSLTFKDGEVIPKNLESFAIMTQYYHMIEPDVLAIRGEHDGASHKDFGFNSRIFRQDESLLIEFYDCVLSLFDALKNNPKVKVIKFDNQSNITEYAVSYAFGNRMISIGITHLRMGNTMVINERDLFPYVLLFKEGKKKNFGRVLSREAVVNGQIKIFNEVEFMSSSSVYIYESLYLLLHLLPEKTWNKPYAQKCIRFLLGELQKFKEKSGRLLYCVNIPEKAK